MWAHLGIDATTAKSNNVVGAGYIEAAQIKGNNDPRKCQIRNRE